MAGLEAARLYWQLDAIGHQQKSILNGGLVKWILEGREVNADRVERSMIKYQMNTDKIRVNSAYLGDITKEDEATLLDVRSYEEYTGNAKYPRSGHIPGAKFFPWDSTIQINKQFTFKDLQLIQNQLNGIGLSDKSAAIIIYCQSGHRAAHSYFILRQLGYNNVRIYDGSMAEYQLYKQFPLKLGSAP